MKMFQTVLNVTAITVQSGSTNSAGKPVRDVVIATPDGELVLHLIGEVREDLQVMFAGSEHSGAKASREKEPAA